MEIRLQKWGNSDGVRIPKKMLDELHLSTGDVMDISIKNGNFVIRPKKKHIPTIDELFADYSGKKQNEVDWGSPEGNETW